VVLPLSNVVICSLFGYQSHCHSADHGAAPNAKVIAAIKTKATENIFRPAAEIVDEVVLAVKQQGPGLPLKSGTYLYLWPKSGFDGGHFEFCS